MISVNFKVLQTSVAVRTAGCRKGQWRNKAPKAFSCPAPISAHRKSAQNLAQPARALFLPSRTPARPHSGPQGRTRGIFCSASQPSVSETQKESRTNWHDSLNRIFGFTSPAPVRCAAPAPSEIPSCNPKSSPCARSAWSGRIHAGSAAVPGHLRESYGSHRGRFLNRHA